LLALPLCSQYLKVQLCYHGRFNSAFKAMNWTDCSTHHSQILLI
jgi:hypothetical protein